MAGRVACQPAGWVLYGFLPHSPCLGLSLQCHPLPLAIAIVLFAAQGLRVRAIPRRGCENTDYVMP